MKRFSPAAGTTYEDWTRSYRSIIVPLNALPSGDESGTEFLPFRIESDTVGRQVLGCKRDKDSLHSVGRSFGTQQHAGFATFRAAEMSVERNILIGPVQEKPAAAGARFDGSGDFAVLELPIGLPEWMPPAESRTPHGRVGLE